MNDQKTKTQDLSAENEELRMAHEGEGDQDQETRNGEEELLRERIKDAEEKYRRALADYRNLESQVRIERMNYVKMANRMLIESLLEPLSFMETATAHINDKGLAMVIDRFYQVLRDEGLEEIPVKAGDLFDEATMEAIDTVEGKENTVIEVKQKGFRLNGTVIQHAKVVVGSG